MKTKRTSPVWGALLAGMAMTGCGGGGGSEAPAPTAQAPQPEAPTPAPAPTGRHMHPGSVSVLFADWIGSKRAFVEAANGPSRLMPVGCNARLQCGLNISGLPTIDLYEQGTGLRPSEGTERFPQSDGGYFHISEYRWLHDEEGKDEQSSEIKRVILIPSDQVTLVEFLYLDH